MDFLVFRRMVVPVLVQVLFWIGVALCIIGALVLIAGGGALLGLVLLFLGPFMGRIYCELVMVIFRINETLSDIKNELRRNPR